MRVVTWNLYHGRTVPPCGRDMLEAFTAALAGWEWDVALLQEVPPWWPPLLAAQQRTQLTSRNWLLPVRRWISERNPDILKSNGGGANAILVRGGEILEHRAARLRRRPEARWVHGVRLAGGWYVNVHSHNRPEPLARADTEAAAEHARRWAAGAPLIFGGDINLKRPPELAGLVHLGGNHVDHLYSEGRPGRHEVLDRGRLSDHPPVAVTVA